MKKIIYLAIIIIITLITFCGCENLFSNDDKKSSTTETTTVEETTVQGNSEVVTLETTSTTAPKAKEVMYYSENIGASFTLPAAWENKYAVEDSVDDSGNKYVSFFEKDIHRIDGKGLIFTYNLFLTKSYKKTENYTEYGTITFEDGTTYYMVCTLPTSSQYDENNKSLKKVYTSLSKEQYISSICSSVYFTNDVTIDEEGCSTKPSSQATLTTSAGDTTKPKQASAGTAGLVFPDVSSRYLTDSEIKALSGDQIQQAINDICAIHGYNFTTPEIKAHYEQFDWYSPSSDFSEATFNDVEKSNYELLQKYR